MCEESAFLNTLPATAFFWGKRWGGWVEGMSGGGGGHESDLTSMPGKYVGGGAGRIQVNVSSLNVIFASDFGF